MTRAAQAGRKVSEEIRKVLQGDQLICLNAHLSSLNVASEISNVATLSTLIGLPVSLPLGVISLAGVSVSGIAMVLTKSTRRNLQKSLS